MNPEVLLGAYGVSFQWGRSQAARAKGISEVSFELCSGQVLALVGPNGSGKTTLLRAVAGLISPIEGVILYRGKPLLSLPHRERARSVGYVPHDLSSSFPLTAYEAVALGKTLQSDRLFHPLLKRDRDAIQNAMEECLCWNLRDRLFDQLSGGERQLVNLARVIAQGSKILFLDEALGKMDLHHQALIGRKLKKWAGFGFGIVLVAHDVNFALEWADTILLMKEGRTVAQGAVNQVISSEILKVLYPEAPITLGQNPFTGSPCVFTANQSK